MGKRAGGQAGIPAAPASHGARPTAPACSCRTRALACPVAWVDPRHPVRAADCAPVLCVHKVAGQVSAEDGHAGPPTLPCQLHRGRMWAGGGGKRASGGCPRRIRGVQGRGLEGTAGPAAQHGHGPSARCRPPHVVAAAVALAQAAAVQEGLPRQLWQALLLRHTRVQVGRRRCGPCLSKGQRCGRGHQHKVARVDCGWTLGGVRGWGAVVWYAQVPLGAVWQARQAWRGSCTQAAHRASPPATPHLRLPPR